MKNVHFPGFQEFSVAETAIVINDVGNFWNPSFRSVSVWKFQRLPCFELREERVFENTTLSLNNLEHPHSQSQIQYKHIVN